MLAFVVCHLSAHSALLISSDFAQPVLLALMGPWRTVFGTTLLASALLVHYSNALWSIYVRRHLRLSTWEWCQLGLGLLIPVLLMNHVISTRVAEHLAGVDSYYGSVLVVQWVVWPWLGAVQMVAVLTVWIHACIGIHFWLRTKPWYDDWRPAFAAFGLLLPTLALAGYVSAGNQVLREAGASPDFARQALENANLSDAAIAEIRRVTAIGWSAHLALVLLPFGGRGVRAWWDRRSRPPMLTHAGGRTMAMLSGATVLETLREAGIPHASVCGGRARCTTCRIQVTKGLAALAPPEALEARALARFEATPGVRLACQIRPTADLSVTPLLSAEASSADGATRGGLEGSERYITVVFVDLRGSTTMAEARMPYDVLFILNLFFEQMTQALADTGGHYSQFTGDGLMALYGLHDGDPATGAAAAVRGAREMLSRLETLNRRLTGVLSQPLRIGIGIHFSEAIVGSMGPPGAKIVSAIGDTVNTCARLESLTKEYDCSLIVSRRAAEAAGLDVGDQKLHQAPVKGRVETVQFYALASVPDGWARTASRFGG
ncbi:MAG: adenylate/guanylate cyclase domain-containing protein [Betaproteobacteria bacterium]